MLSASERAWNNFVLLSDPSVLEIGSDMRAAALASLFLSGANNGGLNSFLTASFEYDPIEVHSALASVGAPKAAQQLGKILDRLDSPLQPSTQEMRWDQLDRLWTADLDQYDVLSEEADNELMRALARHVSINEAYYLGLDGEDD